MRVTVESCSSISIHVLQKAIRKIIDTNYPEATEDEIYVYTLEELKKFTINDQIFEYYARPVYYGGHRWFFLCPKCKRYVNKLFLPPINTDRERRYLCKICHKLKNKSAITSQNSMYKMVIRPLLRMKEIEDKIARGHLKPEKIKELLDEYEEIERKMKNTPEYRLYSFKKKHGLINNVLIN